jgi:mRNA interferase MazF
MDQLSEILIDQIRALDNRRFLERLGKLDSEKAKEIQWKLKATLDF